MFAYMLDAIESYLPPCLQRMYIAHGEAIKNKRYAPEFIWRNGAFRKQPEAFPE